MESNSEGENQNRGSSANNNIGNSNEGHSRPKRQMKTPFQLEALEKAYALEAYPSEAMRADLSQKLGLSDRQLQMWFCHRRLKDKKETPAKKPRKAVPLESPVEEMRAMAPEPEPEPGSDYGSGSGSGSSPFMEPRKVSLDDMPMIRRYYESSPQSVMELRAIACVEAQLGEPLREDGPILGMEFDPLPPDAFGAPIAMAEQQKRPMHSYAGEVYERHDAKSSKVAAKIPSQVSARAFHEYQFLQDQSSIRSDAYGQVDQSPYRDPSVDIPRDIFPDAQIFHTDTDLRIGKKCKNDEARITREVEARENQIRKELEKQDQLRRKSEERMRKEMEKQERERRKEEDRLIRERQREEERSLREQKRELERREKFLQKEYLRAEKKRQKEELRREKEAVKRQAAIEKATARRIAKESLDLIEDEQLELMELAAASKGLTSVVHLNYDTLQNLDSFRDSLSIFPPESIQLKKPFAIQPWMDSEENIGNLLMVWKFFITFADVLGLWPFTLDEFVQAFHDYDSRLLGEVHLALLKLIIKDIEDVARTPSTGLGANQYCAANPEGGHLQIVEGAYIWGFDIRNWQRHLNPLTWPEIFRQLALSAGFGPRLKKRSSTRTYLGDNDEVKGCEDTISTLRNGSAAENAFSLMRERGLLLPRRSRHRLTPGTVKKDPADAEAILSAARKKIRIFENGFSGGEDVDDVERDEDSEGDIDEDPEVDDLTTPLSANRSADHSIEANTCSGSGKDNLCNGIPLIAQNELVKEPSSIHLNGPKDAKTPSSTEQCVPHEDVGVRNVDQENIEIDESKSGESWIQGLAEGEYAHLSVEERLNSLVALVGIANEGNTIRAVLEDRLEAANALKKQMWAEAQLDRSRLKEDIVSKLDFPSLIGGKAEIQVTSSVVEGGQSPLPLDDSKNKEASPSTAVDQKPLPASRNVQNHHNSVPTEKTLMVQDLSVNPDNFSSQQHGYASKRSRSQLKAYIGHIAEETYVYRSLPLGQDRRHNRYWQFVASASKNDPCSGRIFVELHDGNWRLIDSEEAFDALLSSLDTRGIRESHLRIMLQKIEKSFKQNVRRNFQSENIVCQNGIAAENEVGEADSSPNCSAGIGSPSSMVCGSSSDALDTSSLFRIELGRNEMEQKGAMKRYQDFQKWTWKECFNSLTLCAMKYGKKRCSQLLTTCDVCFDSYLAEDSDSVSCHQTLNAADKSFNFLEHGIQCKVKRKLDPGVCDTSLPLGIRLLNALLAFIEILTVLESAIKRDYLSANFEMTKELLGSATSAQSALYGSTDLGSVPVLPWIPKPLPLWL
ncbi:hypothetical protein GH714_002611 [Hevea brasiliensis]|uniref:Homeobox domain-containing protein n=1 Tax=Hevea brasiliensis TaxID=3981 RepID=A0A6A6LCD9_HEVBR|nr:hypothetical protein GH714_002611 [Hevea brasiliensis]